MRAGTAGVGAPLPPGPVRAGACGVGQVCDHVSPDVHEVLVHAPRVLGGDWDGDPVLLQVRRHRAGVRRQLRADARARPSGLGFLSRSQTAPDSGPHAGKTLHHPGLFPLLRAARRGGEGPVAGCEHTETTRLRV